MDFQALVLDLQGEGVNFDNLWSGPGIPFGGSLIMMTLDIILYACLAYYFDSVIPSTYLQMFPKTVIELSLNSERLTMNRFHSGEYGIKRNSWFCFTPGFWCQRKAPRVGLLNNNYTTKRMRREVEKNVFTVVFTGPVV